MTASPRPVALLRPGEVHLRLLSTTDLHVHVAPYDYYADRPVDTLGLARTGGVVRDLARGAANTLLVDNGDYLQGNPMGDYIAYERGMRAGDLHPMIAAMNVLGYAAGTIGNHDFNYGIDFLDRVNAGAAHPIVCANFARSLGADPRRDRLWARPYVLLDREVLDGSGQRHPLRIGLIGFVPPQIMRWDARHLEGRFAARDILAAARAWVPEMREAGADLVVALCHSGILAAPETDGMEHAALHLAAVPGIDAVVAGHQHMVFPAPKFATSPGIDPVQGRLHGKPAVMAGCWGSHVGVIDLHLARDGGGWRVLGTQSAACPIYDRTDAAVAPRAEVQPDVMAAVADAHAATLAYVRRPVGQTAVALQSYFALVSDDVSVQVVNEAQAWYVGDMLRGTPWAGIPLLSAAAPFKAGGRGGPDHYTDVAPGPLAIRNVADLYLYPNMIRAVVVDGAGLADWLEMAAGIFRTLVPGVADQPLIDPDFPSFNADVIAGVTYRIDVTAPARYDATGRLRDHSARRIRDLAFGGAPVAPTDRFVVATNDYRAGGGGNFPGLDAAAVIFEGPDTNRDVLIRFIHAGGTLNPVLRTTWGFAPSPGTSALFESGRGGRAHLGWVRGARIEDAGDAPNGFALYRLSL